MQAQFHAKTNTKIALVLLICVITQFQPCHSHHHGTVRFVWSHENTEGNLACETLIFTI